MKNVSYLVIISGYASKLIDPKEKNDYVLSYNRAYCLWSYWKKLGIDFEDEKYKGLIDLQISGNGWGGVGRFRRDLGDTFGRGAAAFIGAESLTEGAKKFFELENQSGPGRAEKIETAAAAITSVTIVFLRFPCWLRSFLIDCFVYIDFYRQPSHYSFRHCDHVGSR